mmetsp:Transcript_62719/g.161401  ORF Transcript_62719/g.161401 Transcript_62719/m.161401 type:complete len:305 (+) Transcript_62719:357-1271(+)
MEEAVENSVRRLGGQRVDEEAQEPIHRDRGEVDPFVHQVLPKPRQVRLDQRFHQPEVASEAAHGGRVILRRQQVLDEAAQHPERSLLLVVHQKCGRNEVHGLTIPDLRVLGGEGQQHVAQRPALRSCDARPGHVDLYHGLGLVLQLQPGSHQVPVGLIRLLLLGGRAAAVVPNRATKRCGYTLADGGREAVPLCAVALEPSSDLGPQVVALVVRLPPPAFVRLRRGRPGRLAVGRVVALRQRIRQPVPDVYAWPWAWEEAEVEAPFNRLLVVRRRRGERGHNCFGAIAKRVLLCRSRRDGFKVP